MIDGCRWGLKVYEQDWLDREVLHLGELTRSATLGDTWLDQIGSAADAHGLSVQFCMAYPRHVLASAGLPAVTQARGGACAPAPFLSRGDDSPVLSAARITPAPSFLPVQARASADYQPGAYEQWAPLGITSLFAYALGLAPSKDSYWSTSDQPGADFYKPRVPREAHPRLQAAVSTLSKGPVAPSDGIGYSDAELINRACASDGTLLSPGRPATKLDDFIIADAFAAAAPAPSSHQAAGTPMGEVWLADTHVSGRRYAVVLSAELRAPYTLSSAQLGYGASEALVATESNSTDAFITVSGGRGLPLSACGSNRRNTCIPLRRRAARLCSVHARRF